MATIKGFQVGGNTVKYQDSFIADEFSESENYYVGDHVFYDGQLYKCIANVAAGQWTGNTNWTQTVIGNDVSGFTKQIVEVQAAQPSDQYNRIWVQPGDGNGVEIPTMEDLEEFGENLAPLYDEVAGVYAIGDYCTYSGEMYKCKAAIQTPEEWHPQHWDKVTVGEELKRILLLLSNL